MLIHPHYLNKIIDVDPTSIYNNCLLTCYWYRRVTLYALLFTLFAYLRLYFNIMTTISVLHAADS
jgi:hypothetical protein